MRTVASFSAAKPSVSPMKIKITLKDLQKSSSAFLPQKTSEQSFEGLLSLQNLRNTVAQETRKLSKTDFTKIEFNPLVQDRKVAEGFVLGSYDYKRIARLKTDSKQLEDETVKTREYEIGQIYGTAQNYAREFMDTPANLMTPTIFCERATDLFKDSDTVQVKVREKEWAESKGMGAFLSVGRGSDEPLKFLELHYNGGDKGDKPLVLVGKGRQP
jgi:cytosol aminopeptidase